MGYYFIHWSYFLSFFFFTYKIGVKNDPPKNIQMVNKHVKICSTLLVNREMQIDSTSQPLIWV